MLLFALGLLVGFICGLSSARKLRDAVSAAAFEINFPP
jgi:hypothetical protein